MFSKYNIDSHTDGRRVSYAWAAGMISTKHTTHVSTKLGVLAVRPGYARNGKVEIRLDFQPHGTHSNDRQTFISDDIEALIIWALERVNGDVAADVNPGDSIQVYANQATRDGDVLAVDGTDVLIEYEMPAGTTALRLIKVVERHYDMVLGKRISYATVPQVWIDRMKEAGTEWIGNGQRSVRAFPR